MSIVRILINEPSTPTENEIKNFKKQALRELSEINNFDEEIFCDEDCPELTDEQISRLMPVHAHEKIFLEELNG